jgi:Na+-translocating ferredoxin:NAD+ oxidoreductase RnfG subunit
MMGKSLAIAAILSIILMASPQLMAIKLSPETIKLIEKRVEKAFGAEHVKFEPINPDAYPSKDICWGFSDNSLYKIIVDSSIAGYLVLDQAKGRYDYFDFMVVFSAQVEIMDVEVLLYRSEHGGEITSRKWLKKFIGLKDWGKNKTTQNVDAISGATISSNGMKNAIEKIGRSLLSIVPRQ